MSRKIFFPHRTIPSSRCLKGWHLYTPKPRGRHHVFHGLSGVADPYSAFQVWMAIGWVVFITVWKREKDRNNRKQRRKQHPSGHWVRKRKTMTKIRLSEAGPGVLSFHSSSMFICKSVQTQEHANHHSKCLTTYFYIWLLSWNHRITGALLK